MASLVSTVAQGADRTSREGITGASAATQPSPKTVVAQFHATVEPILEQRCYACHAGSDNHTPVAFDELRSDGSIAANPDLWMKVLQNMRSHIMPPPDQEQLTADQRAAMEQWIKYSAFGVDAAHLDPGRQALRRLNRAEYHNSVMDLLGVDFDVDTQFPSDDIGYGFDNIGDILNVSPMLMEKYVQAAQTIVAQGVPLSARVVAVEKVPGGRFVSIGDSGVAAETGATTAASKPAKGAPRGSRNGGSLDLTFVKAAKYAHDFNVSTEGDYKLSITTDVRGGFDFTPERCVVVISENGVELSRKMYVWKDPSLATEEIIRHWSAGTHKLMVTLTPAEPSTRPKPTAPAPPPPVPAVAEVSPASPATPASSPPQQRRRFVRPPPDPPQYRLLNVQLEGPEDPAHWVRSVAYDRFFSRSEPPAGSAERTEYAREVIGKFATRAFRRPVPEATLDRLTEIAQSVYQSPGKTFEQGVAEATVAVLASPRFLFRIETAEPVESQSAFVDVDEYTLASRLSYFLWSTMPDEELITLAGKRELRRNLAAQVDRMVADPRSKALVENFTGQWLQSREVDNIAINVHEVLAREGVSVPFNDQVPGPVRAALKEEPKAYFNYIMQNDRSVNEFLESDYTFLNQTLADFYKIPDVTGPQMRKVTLPARDPRGGTLTMGATLMVTSNPTRTSPVKRGKWVLENILGAPTPPPPPDIPPLELAEKQMASAKKPTLRQILATHRSNPQCASCHDRMDPIGLAMENFNAEGMYRTMELNQPIDTSGQLFTGESFHDISELKQALVKNHLREFYRCLTEKMMIYATGRGMEYYDVPTIDKIVEQLEREQGRFSVLLSGVVESAPFQQRRANQNRVEEAK